MDKKMTIIEIKKLLSKYSSVNLLNDYTLQDVEDAKKRCYAQMVRERAGNTEELKVFLDSITTQLMEDKFALGTEKAVGAVIKNTVRDNLNPDYKNTIKRIINLDSQYRPNIYPYSNSDTSETNYLSHLTEKLVNVVSMQLEYIQIPFTFYNIEAAQGNNYFFIGDQLIMISDGNYTLDTLITALNTNPTITNLNIEFSIDPINGKTTINSTTPVIFTFFDSLDELSSESYTKYNNNLGWMLGFRNIQNNDTQITLEYTLEYTNSSITSEAIAMINTTKYIIIVVDEFNQNTTSGTLVQTELEIAQIKPTTYWQHQDKTKCLNNINCENFQTYIDSSRTLTKAQLYSQSQLNQNKKVIQQQSLRLDCLTPNNVLGILPFDTSHTWGEHYFSDKIDYKREYHGPIDIEKLHIQLYNDKGIPLNFNGNDWYMTITTEHLYKY